MGRWYSALLAANMSLRSNAEDAALAAAESYSGLAPSDSLGEQSASTAGYPGPFEGGSQISSSEAGAAGAMPPADPPGLVRHAQSLAFEASMSVQ